MPSVVRPQSSAQMRQRASCHLSTRTGTIEVVGGSREQSRRGIVVLLAATVLCYLIGYPLALIGRSAVGWIFVSLGGPLLIALGVTVIRQIHARAEETRRLADRPDRA